MYRVVYNGANLKIYINGVLIDDATYIAFTPQQAVLPVYSVFDETPTLFMKGNALIKGTLGMNVYYAQGLEALVGRDEGGIVKWGEFVYYAKTMVIEGTKEEFAEGLDPTIIRQIAQNKGEAAKGRPVGYIIKSTWTLEDVYLMGGGISAAPDGNPLQRVYNFFARKYSVEDKQIGKTAKFIEYINEREEKPQLKPSENTGFERV